MAEEKVGRTLRNWMLLCAVGVALALLFIALGFHSRVLWDRYGDVVIIENRADQPISNVSLIFQGGECKLTQMPAKSSRTVLVTLLGESSLNFSFYSPDQVQHGDHLELYLEPYYAGEVRIVVDPNYRTTWKNMTRLGPF